MKKETLDKAFYFIIGFLTGGTIMAGFSMIIYAITQ